MNDSINYSSFIDLLISSDDDYESYGMSTHPDTPGHMASQAEFEPLQATLYDVDMDRWHGE